MGSGCVECEAVKGPMHEATIVCVLCNARVESIGNVAAPVAHGVCCNVCNVAVILERLRVHKNNELFRHRLDVASVERGTDNVLATVHGAKRRSRALN